MENRLMTIVFIDMQGYTKRSASQTIEEMKLFHDQMFKFVSDTVEKGGGVMVKTMGDGFMVRFDSPTRAVQTGIEIQKRLESRNAQMMNPESIVRFRIGINTGEVGIDENGDLFGDPVNIAARIQTFADTNDVFISETTYLAMNRNEFGSVDLGAQELKNATREIKIYKVLKNGSPGVTLPGAKKPVQAPVSTGLADSHKKMLVAAVVGALALVTLVAGIYIGARRSRRAQQQQPVSMQAHEQQPNHESQSPDRPDGGTLLQVDPSELKVNLNEHERRMIGDIQGLFYKQQFNRAEVLCAEMVYRSGDMQKPVFALLLSEIFWMQNKNKDAEKIFDNIRNSGIPPQGKVMCEAQIAKIKARKAL